MSWLSLRCSREFPQCHAAKSNLGIRNPDAPDRQNCLQAIQQSILPHWLMKAWNTSNTSSASCFSKDCYLSLPCQYLKSRVHTALPSVKSHLQLSARNIWSLTSIYVYHDTFQFEKRLKPILFLVFPKYVYCTVDSRAFISLGLTWCFSL